MATQISSPHNPRIKSAARLRERRGREQQGRIIIDGARETLRAIEHGAEVIEVYVCRELFQSEDCQRVIAATEQAAPCEIIEVTAQVFAKIAFGDRSDGIVAVAHAPNKPLSALTLPECPLVAVLEGVEKPGNVGAVIRSADGAAVSAVVIADGGTDLFNPNAIRASLGLIFAMPLASATSQEVRDWLLDNELNVVAAFVDADRNYTDVDFTKPTAIVLGSEAEGLSDVWRDPRVTGVRVPMLGAGDSLNVSATAAALFYEAQRQRHS